MVTWLQISFSLVVGMVLSVTKTVTTGYNGYKGIKSVQSVSFKHQKVQNQK